MVDAQETTPITATISQFVRLSGISRSRIYELLDAREIESVYIGSRRLILIESFYQLLQRQRQAQQRPIDAHAKPAGR
jgi:hypothetical protein